MLLIPSLLHDVCETKYVEICIDVDLYVKHLLMIRLLQIIYETDRFDEYYDLYCMLARLQYKIDYQYDLSDSTVRERYTLLMNVFNLINHCFEYATVHFY